MAYPAGVKTTTLTVGGGAITGLGTPATVKVYVRPTHFLVWEADGSPVIPMQESLPKASETLVELPQVDQAGFIDQQGHAFTGWAYTVTVYYRAKGSSVDYVVAKTVQPVAGQDVIDFEIVPGDAPLPPITGPATVVTSIDGITGRVTADDIRGLLGNTVGIQGPVGERGLQGEPGLRGADGARGIDGLPGTPGAKGDAGTPGIQGERGLQGTPGVKGDQGNPGTKGDTGTAGTSGTAGAKGDQGIQGVQGTPGVVTLSTLPSGFLVSQDWDGVPPEPNRITARADIVVRWRSPEPPTNMLDGDEWVNTTP